MTRARRVAQQALRMMVLMGALVAVAASSAWAGPVIIDGTDANDHGSVSGGVNENGWLYMQKALENIAGQIAAGVTKVVADVGTTSSDARNSIDSAFTLSSLPGAGWTLTHVDGAAPIDAWLAALSTANTGILYIPTAGNAVGDLIGAELAIINARATEINNFVAGAGDPTMGGGLFSQGESPGAIGAYGWLTTLIPGIVVTDVGGGGVGADMTLTADGIAAFPGLTNADLAGADPWHNHFSGNLGGLKILATAPQGGTTRNIILGGGAGTVIGCGLPGQPACPTHDQVIPEPSSLLLFGLGGLGAGLVRRRRTKPRKT